MAPRSTAFRVKSLENQRFLASGIFDFFSFVLFATFRSESHGATEMRPQDRENPPVTNRTCSPVWQVGAAMADDEMLTPKQAASRLGVTTTTLYDWLGRSRRGLFVVHGHPVTVEFFQTGAMGQGRIMIPATEIARLKELMRVHVERIRCRRLPVHRDLFPGITVPLGRPD